MSTTAPQPESNLVSDFLSPGEKFGDYQVMQCLTFGMIGALYRMQHIREFNEACLIVLPRAVGSFPGFRDRFVEVVAKLQTIRHPHVLQVTGSEIVKDRYCLFTEMVDGVNLNDYMDEFVRQRQSESGAPGAGSGASGSASEAKTATPEAEQSLGEKSIGLPPPVVKAILQQTGEAVKAVAETGLHHYNLNPTCLLLAPDGKVKVFGFGLMEMYGKELFERIVSAAIPPVQIGMRKVNINTIDTLSPEVRAGKAAEARSDLYALGLTSYFLLTGHKPGNPPKAPSAYSAAIPNGWDKLVLRCLSPQPEGRPPTAAAFVAEVAKLETSASVEAKKQKTVGAKLAKSSPMLLKVVGGIAAVVALLAVLVAVVVPLLFPAEPPPAVAMATAERPANFRLQTTPPTAEAVFTSNQAQTGTLAVRQGRLEARLADGTWTVRVQARGYRPATRTFSLQGGAPFEQSVTLEPIYAWLQVVQGVPGARITATLPGGEKVPLGVVGEDGTLAVRDKLMAGTVALTSELENYFTTTDENVVLEGEKWTQYPAPLVPLPGTLHITSEPAGAEVTIEGARVGVTPLSLPEYEALRPWVVSVVAPGFRPSQREAIIPPAGEARLDFGALTPRNGDLLVQAKLGGLPATPAQIAQMRVRSGEQEFPVGVLDIKGLIEGEREISVEHPDYFPATAQLRMDDGAYYTVAVELQPRPAQVKVQANPAGTVFLLVRGQQVNGSNNTFAIPPGTDYTLEFHQLNYLPVSRTLSVGPNEQVTLAFDFTRIPPPTEGRAYTVPYVGTELLWVAPGTFSMGSPPPEIERRPEENQVAVTLSRGFWVGKYEVTQQEWVQVMQSNPSATSQRGARRPVDSVTWTAAVEFARLLTERERAAGRLPNGFVYRLPTEAEWEYVARAGTTSPFFWGGSADSTQGNYKGRYPRESGSAVTSADGVTGTLPVGSFSANAWGLHDVHGNVREWTNDRWNARLPAIAQTDPTGPSTGEARVWRGGGWEDFAHRCRSAARDNALPANTGVSMGLRLVLAPALAP